MNLYKQSLFYDNSGQILCFAFLKKEGDVIMTNLRKLILAALLAALTTATTMVVRIPTPTMGYIHPGDAMVLLCGLLLGPVTGGLAAGIGSALSDFFAGYLAYVPGTFVIKALTAVIAALLSAWLTHITRHAQDPSNLASSSLMTGRKNVISAVICGGVAGETFMVFGYFIYEILLAILAAGSGFTSTVISAAIVSSAAGIPFNIVQGITGVILAAILCPILYPLTRRLLQADN